MTQLPPPVDSPGHAAPIGGGKLIAALVIGQLGLHGAMAGLRMAAPLQALNEGYSAWSVGLLLALFAAAPVLLALPAGRMADRHGYHKPVRLASAITVGGLIAAVLATFVQGGAHFALLCLAAMASGTGANTGMLTIQRTGGRVARDAIERVRVFSWLSIAPSFANVIGPVAVGFMIDAAGFRAGYALLLAMPVLTLITARFVPRQQPAGSGPRNADGRRWGLRDLIAVPGMKRLLSINWLLSMCWDVHAFAVPILGHERGFSASTIGLILGTFTLSVTLVRFAIPLIAHRLSEVQVLRAAMLGTGFVFAAYPLAPNPWALGGLAVLLGITLGCVQPMIMSVLHDLTPESHHGQALAVRSMTINTSSTVMPLVFGATGTLVGAAVLFWAVGAAVGAGAWLARRLRPAPGA